MEEHKIIKYEISFHGEMIKFHTEKINELKNKISETQVNCNAINLLKEHEMNNFIENDIIRLRMIKAREQLEKKSSELNITPSVKIEDIVKKNEYTTEETENIVEKNKYTTEETEDIVKKNENPSDEVENAVEKNENSSDEAEDKIITLSKLSKYKKTEQNKIIKNIYEKAVARINKLAENNEYYKNNKEEEINKKADELLKIFLEK